jgi:hypothetical protein
MGDVYLAHDTDLDRRVALKVPRFAAEDDPDARERFLQEARAAAALDHPNICPVYDVGRFNGRPYLTMAYVDGRPLSELLRDGRTFSPAEAAGLARALALALVAAHRQGVVHRDVKPGNVLIDRQGRPVLTDFGLARRVNAGDARLTRRGALVGTPAYMAPEQVLGKDCDFRCDVYSLGVVLYELLAGRLPFSGSIESVLGQILRADPEAPSKHRPGIPPGLEAICLKALARRPEDRYRSMEELAAALGAWLGQRPAPRRRRARLALVTLAVLLALLVGAGARLGWFVPANVPGEREDGQAAAPAPAAPVGPPPGAPVVPAGLPVRPAPEKGPQAGPAPVQVVKESALLGRHDGAVSTVAFSARAKGAEVISGSTADHTVRWWGLAEGKEIAEKRVVLREDVTIFGGQVTLSADGRYLQFTTGRSYLWNLETGQEVRWWDEGHIFEQGPRGFSRTGQWVIGGHMDGGGSGYAYVLDVETGRGVRLQGHPFNADLSLGHPVVALSPVADRAATAWKDGLCLWEVAAPKKEKYRLPRTGVTCMAFSPDGETLLAGERANALILWDFKTGKQLARFEGHTGAVTGVVFCPDGKRALSASEDGTARLWDVKTGRELARLEGHAGAVTCVTVSEDGRALTGGADRTVRLWRLPGAGSGALRVRGHSGPTL